MKVAFSDIVRINKSAKKYVLFEQIGNTYRMYFTNKQPGEYGFHPRHHIENGIFLSVEDAREQLKDSNEIKSN